MLPKGHPIVGLDEQTGLILDLHNLTGKVVGKGKVHVWVDGSVTNFGEEDKFILDLLGEIKTPTENLIPEDNLVGSGENSINAHSRYKLPLSIPAEIILLVEERQNARVRQGLADF